MYIYNGEAVVEVEVGSRNGRGQRRFDVYIPLLINKGIVLPTFERFDNKAPLIYLTYKATLFSSGNLRFTQLFVRTEQRIDTSMRKK